MLAICRRSCGVIPCGTPDLAEFIHNICAGDFAAGRAVCAVLEWSRQGRKQMRGQRGVTYWNRGCLSEALNWGNLRNRVSSWRQTSKFGSPAMRG